MTEEEIRPIAENYVEEFCHCPDGEYTDGSLVCAGIGTALIVSRQLEKQIEIDAEQIRALQKQNGELTDRIVDLQHKLDTLQGFLDHDIEYDMDKTIQELRKENEELRVESAFCEKACEGATMMYEQLTKATELLKKIIDTPVFNQTGGEMYENEEYKELTTKAEQFLKELDNDKEKRT